MVIENNEELSGYFNFWTFEFIQSLVVSIEAVSHIGLAHKCIKPV